MAKNGRKKKQSNFNLLSWFVYTVLVSLPTVWFTVIVPYFGDSMKLTKVVNEQIHFTKLGFVSTIIIAIIILVVMYYSNRYYVQSEINDLQYEVSYLRSITDNVDRVCDEKYSQLQRSIVETKERNIEAPKIISNPNHQLRSILTAITSCLLDLMQSPDITFEFKDFYVTLTYNFPQENDVWEWTDGTTEKDMTLEELLEDGAKSTFNYLRTSKKPYYFNNRKEDARKEDRYLYNPQDEISADNGEPVGSIFCYNYKIKKGKVVYINAMLSISTQKKRFAPDGDKSQCDNARENLVLLTRDYFGKRVGIELSLLYLEYLKKSESIDI